MIAEGIIATQVKREARFRFVIDREVTAHDDRGTDVDPVVL